MPKLYKLNNFQFLKSAGRAGQPPAGTGRNRPGRRRADRPSRSINITNGQGR